MAARTKIGALKVVLRMGSTSKVAEICELYLSPPPGSVVLSIDEKTGMQALERRFPERPAAPGRLRRREFVLKFMDKVAAEHPVGTVHVIWDNLNIHYDGDENRWTRFNERHGNRFVFHYTPKHASWVNQVELFFSILQRQCLRDASFSSKEALREAVLAFIAGWNQEKARPFRWTFTGYPLQTGMEAA